MPNLLSPMMHTKEAKTKIPERQIQNNKTNVLNEYELEKSIGEIKKSDEKVGEIQQSNNAMNQESQEDTLQKKR